MEMILVRTVFFVAAFAALALRFSLVKAERPGAGFSMFVFGGSLAIAILPGTDQIWHDLCQWLGAP